MQARSTHLADPAAILCAKQESQPLPAYNCMQCSKPFACVKDYETHFQYNDYKLSICEMPCHDLYFFLNPGASRSLLPNWPELYAAEAAVTNAAEDHIPASKPASKPSKLSKLPKTEKKLFWQSLRADAPQPRSPKKPHKVACVFCALQFSSEAKKDSHVKTLHGHAGYRNAFDDTPFYEEQARLARIEKARKDRLQQFITDFPHVKFT